MDGVILMLELYAGNSKPMELLVSHTNKHPPYNALLIAGEAVENSTLYTRPKKATRYSNVYCRGNEEMLEDCRHHTIEINEGKKYDGPIAAVDCKGTPIAISYQCLTYIESINSYTSPLNHIIGLFSNWFY